MPFQKAMPPMITLPWLATNLGGYIRFRSALDNS
jgi:hypothetical protein